MSFVIQCACGQLMTVEDSHIGRDVSCVNCRQHLRVPDAPSEPGAVVMAAPVSGPAPPTGPAGDSHAPAVPGTDPSHVTPHRAALVLVLGLLGFVPCCGLIGAVAAALGTQDIQKMRRGQMDPSGEGTTNIGRILGIIAAALWLIEILVFLGFQALSGVAHRF